MAVGHSDFSVTAPPAPGFHAQLRAFSMAIESELESRELSFPTVLELSLRIRQVANDAESTVEQLAALIRVEPVLSARVIRMANSVIYNRAGRRIDNVAAAIPRIGISSIRVLALVVAMDQLSQEHRSRPMRDLARNVWQHSLDVASWAYALSRSLRVGSPDTALLVGLMSHIGELCLIARVGQYPTVAGDPDAFAEIAQFWGDALTQAILDKLGFPADVVGERDFRVPGGGRWPLASLHDVLHTAALAAESEDPLDPDDAELRRSCAEALRANVGDAFDAVVAAAAPAREELLAALRE